jgi:hypothetical protein
VSFSRHGKKIELVIRLALFLLINWTSLIFQDPISLNGGQGWDGVSYVKVARQLAAHQTPGADAPFVYRIGTPLLVSIYFENDILFGFKVINLIANLITTVLFVFWLRLNLNDWKIRLLLTALFLLMWHGPIRFVYYYAAYTDPWLFVALLSGLIGIQLLKETPTILRICPFRARCFPWGYFP